jgi:hypothetical protein
VIRFTIPIWFRARARLSTTLALTSSLFLVDCYEVRTDPQPSSPSELGVQCCATWRSECGRYEPNNRISICAHEHADQCCQGICEDPDAGPEAGVTSAVARCEQDCLEAAYACTDDDGG